MVSTNSVSPGWRRISILGGLVIAALLANGFTGAWLMRLAYLPADHWWQRFAANLSSLAPFLLLVPFGVAAMGVPILVLARAAASRALAFATLVLIIVVGVGSIPLGWQLKPGESIRLAGLERITLNAQPVIDAIERYRTDNGEYPKTVGALSPEYLTAMPLTGNTIYPEYEFRPAGDGWGRKIPKFEFFVRTPVGILNWDQFVYRPEHDYPPGHSAGSVDRIGNWVYVHE